MDRAPGNPGRKVVGSCQFPLDDCIRIGDTALGIGRLDDDVVVSGAERSHGNVGVEISVADNSPGNSEPQPSWGAAVYRAGDAGDRVCGVNVSEYVEVVLHVSKMADAMMGAMPYVYMQALRGSVQREVCSQNCGSCKEFPALHHAVNYLEA
jgi:hypothetical protein